MAVAGDHRVRPHLAALARRARHAGAVHPAESRPAARRGRLPAARRRSLESVLGQLHGPDPQPEPRPAAAAELRPRSAARPLPNRAGGRRPYRRKRLRVPRRHARDDAAARQRDRPLVRSSAPFRRDPHSARVRALPHHELTRRRGAARLGERRRAHARGHSSGRLLRAARGRRGRGRGWLHRAPPRR